MKQKAFLRPIVRRVSKDSSLAREAGNSAKGCGSSSNYLQAIIDSLEDELIVIDRDYHIIEANSAVLLRHGKRREEVIGRYCYDVSHGAPELCHPPHHECPIKAVWDTGRPARVTHVHVYHVKDEKRERYLDIVASPITDSQGNVTAVAELMRDVTEAKELELKISEAHRNLLALNTVASVVSQSLDMDAVLSSALDKTLEIMKMGTGGILLLDEESKMLYYRVHRGLSDRYAGEMRLHLGEGIAGIVAQTGETMLSEDISNDPKAAYHALLTADGLRAFASVPLHSKGKILGVLNIASHDTHKFSSEDTQLLEGIARQITTAIENARLHQEVQHKDEIHSELLREIFSIQEEERRRIARELHDETSQVIASLAASLEATASMLPESADKPRAILKKAQTLSIGILDDIHKLIYELRPSLLDDMGLVVAARWLAEVNLEAAGIEVDFKTSGRQRRLPPRIEVTLFRVIQEAVNNIARHSHAKNASISLQFKKDVIRVKIKDDGQGFDVQEAISSRERPRGLGLVGMRERAAIVGGTLDIQSQPDKEGTEITIEISLNREEASNGKDKSINRR